MSTTAVRPALANPLAAFEEYLARTRGVCPGTRHNYITYAGLPGGRDRRCCWGRR